MITWNASTDNVGVIGYQFYRGSTQLGVTPTPDWLDTGLAADTAYTYRARAIDAAGNLSPFSATLTARTQANPPPTPGNQCQSDPGKCGFPNAANTGAASGLPNSSRTQFTTAGEKVQNLRLTGCVEVRAANVTFQNVDFAPNTGCFYRVRNFSTGLMILDSTISCGGSNNNGIGDSNLSLLRVEITACENGLNVSGTTTVNDSWIHDLVTANGAHTDGAQFNQGASSIIFGHNTIIVPTPGSTSAIIMWDEGNPQNANVTIANNLLAGGTYTLYCPRMGPVNNIQIVNNRFGSFEFGYANACTGNHITTWSGNVRDSDGSSLPGA